MPNVATVPSVAVVTTGGTIASSRDPNGVSRPALAGTRLMHARDTRTATRLRITDVLSKDSSSLTFADTDRVRHAVVEELTDPHLEGVVVLHGTDTMEETALLVDLHHDDPRPVIFTGAQRTFDHPASDVPSNLTAAIAAAAHPGSRGRGALICFGGQLLPVPGTRKMHTTALDAFRPAPGGPVALERHAPLPWHPISGIRVDIVGVYPGADRVQIDACRAAGAQGIVIEALGSGNANPDIVAAVQDCHDAGIEVVVSTRVPAGRIEPSYGGGGGGHDLVTAGALISTDLRAGQARILLAALLAAHLAHSDLEEEFTRRCRIT